MYHKHTVDQCGEPIITPMQFNIALYIKGLMSFNYSTL